MKCQKKLWANIRNIIKETANCKKLKCFPSIYIHYIIFKKVNFPILGQYFMLVLANANNFDPNFFAVIRMTQWSCIISHFLFMQRVFETHVYILCLQLCAFSFPINEHISSCRSMGCLRAKLMSNIKSIGYQFLLVLDLVSK